MTKPPSISPKVYTHQHQLQLGQPAVASVCIVVTQGNQVEVSWTSNTEPLRASLLVATGLQILINAALTAAADPANHSLVIPVGDLPLPPFPGPASRA